MSAHTATDAPTPLGDNSFSKPDLQGAALLAESFNRNEQPWQKAAVQKTETNFLPNMEITSNDKASTTSDITAGRSENPPLSGDKDPGTRKPVIDDKVGASAGNENADSNKAKKEAGAGTDIANHKDGSAQGSNEKGAEGGKETVRIDENGNRIISYPNGAETTIDPSGKVTRHKAKDGSSREYAYNGSGQMNGYVQRNAQGEVISIVHREGNKWTRFDPATKK